MLQELKFSVFVRHNVYRLGVHLNHLVGGEHYRAELSPCVRGEV
jgi:hypothetical protein